MIFKGFPIGWRVFVPFGGQYNQDTDRQQKSGEENNPVIMWNETELHPQKRPLAEKNCFSGNEAQCEYAPSPLGPRVDRKQALFQQYSADCKSHRPQSDEVKEGNDIIADGV